MCDEAEFPEREAIVASKVVLVVDEDDDVRAQIRACLASRQITCREATTARDALRSALDDPPDLILVDLVLPDQSGLGLCRIVRESPVLAATPIIVLTSRASEIDRVLAFESGVDDFLAKPFYPPELCTAFALRGCGVPWVRRGWGSRRRDPLPRAKHSTRRAWRSNEEPGELS